MIRKILVVNGPNLNLLGKREPEIYGTHSLADIEKSLINEARQKGVMLSFVQSNREAVLIDRIQRAPEEGEGFIIINAAAYTHSSIALRDALLAVAIPFIEVHLSNIYQREKFRHQSLLSDIALGEIIGLGSKGYAYALDYALNYSYTGHLK